MPTKIQTALQVTAVVVVLFHACDAAQVHRRVEPRPRTQDAGRTRAFHELNLAGAPNTAGFVVTGIRKGETRYDLEVDGAAVEARPRGAGLALTGAALVGVVIDLRDAAGEAYELMFAAADTTPFWAGTTAMVPTYSLTYTSDAHMSPQPLCTAGVNEAILFSGERYDAVRKTVTATGSAADGWVNIGCAATALAKLFLVRHTEASQEVPTVREERQAMLKMFTADVCGDGTSFTAHGQPLFWADAKGITRLPQAPSLLEAVWDESGAVCMNRARRPEFESAIEARCGRLPRCTPQSRGHVMSAIPR